MSKSNRKLYGSICLTDLIEATKRQHSAMVKGTNGKVYANVTIWLNDNPDQYDNDASVQLRQKKDSDDKALYVGNLRWSNYDGPVQAGIEDLPETPF